MKNKIVKQKWIDVCSNGDCPKHGEKGVRRYRNCAYCNFYHRGVLINKDGKK
jgi:hypothetical protein